jgi:hypothetical protein
MQNLASANKELLTVTISCFSKSAVDGSLSLVNVAAINNSTLLSNTRAQNPSDGTWLDLVGPFALKYCRKIVFPSSPSRYSAVSDALGC